MPFYWHARIESLCSCSTCKASLSGFTARRIGGTPTRTLETSLTNLAVDLAALDAIAASIVSHRTVSKTLLEERRVVLARST